MDLNALLRRAVDLGASDIHLKLDRAPLIRHDGGIQPLDEPALTGFADEMPLESAALSNELSPQALKVRDVAITITTAQCSAEGR